MGLRTVLVSAFALGATLLAANQVPDPGAYRITRLPNGRINVLATNAWTPDILEGLVRATGRKWVLDLNDYEGTRMVDLKNASLDEALRVVLEGSRIRMVIKDGTYVFTKKPAPAPVLAPVSGAMTTANGVLFVLRDGEVLRYRIKDMKLLGRTKLPK